ncbi:hypothetical protein EDB80DRAFT_710477 [Ilyonectria destructans]|nr:hypothetical protein EDB80DRAFT_710477 [Ilyonectria destructans]
MKPSGRLCSVYFASLIPTTSLLPWGWDRVLRRAAKYFPQPAHRHLSLQWAKEGSRFSCSVATAGQSPFRSAARGCTQGEENSLDPGAHVGQDVGFGIAFSLHFPAFWRQVRQCEKVEWRSGLWPFWTSGV